MRKLIKIIILLCFIFICLNLTGCGKHEHDHIVVWNREDHQFDNIGIDAKDGYFYDRHEKFMVDDNTIAVTIYFVNEESDQWKRKED